MRTQPPPTLPPGFQAPFKEQRGRGKNWRLYRPDVVERARVLVEGTTWPEAYIAKRIGIGVTTVHRWKVARGWRRPEGTPLSTRKVAVGRAGFTRRCLEALRAIEFGAYADAARLADAPELDRKALVRAITVVVMAQRLQRPPRRRKAEIMP